MRVRRGLGRDKVVFFKLTTNKKGILVLVKHKNALIFANIPINRRENQTICYTLTCFTTTFELTLPAPIPPVSIPTKPEIEVWPTRPI